MFEEKFLDELAKAICDRMEKRNNAPRRDWPAVMDLKTAAEYICRTIPAMRNLVRTGQIPAVRGDARIQIRRVDIDNWAAKMTERISA